MGCLKLDYYDNKLDYYDNAGNPTLYKGASLTWTNGRQLASYTASWGSNANYTYDYAGIRTSKTVDGVTTKYFVQGDRILAEKTGSDLTWYYYDETGVCGMQYQGVNYIFEKNILGDIVAIYRVSDGMYMGKYTYNNAWGYGPGTSSNITVAGSSAVLNANPFRYRGYYFDKETCLYYLNSRYYDPETGRFISPDEPTSLFTNATTTFGTNLYIYLLIRTKVRQGKAKLR